MATGLREFLQLAQSFDGSQNIAAWYLSEKMDGWRAWWDGGITRGMPTKNVPWANTAKDHIRLQPPIATGLWSRYGKAIQAPDWFLDKLPVIPLDGELYMGRGRFQDLMSATRRLTPGAEWEQVEYRVFDAPSYREVLADGEIRNKGKYEKVLRGCVEWAIGRAKTTDARFLQIGKRFEETYELLGTLIPSEGTICLHEQNKLPYNVDEAKWFANEFAAKIVDKGGEGVIVRMGGSLWVPKRVKQMLKVKPYKDDEAVVVGYVWGEETTLGSKLLGLMGSVILNWKGKTFRMSGFTDNERVMFLVDRSVQAQALRAFDIGCKNPGQVVPDTVENPKFPRGTTISFQYRELTNDGLPKEARFWRKREG